MVDVHPSQRRTIGLNDTERLSCPPVSAAHFEIGCVIGGYQLIKKLGQGGQGQVYSALSLRPGEYYRQVAIKISNMDEEGADDPCASVALEARRLMNLNHPGVVKVHHSGKEQGRAYLAMENIKGKSVREVMSDSRPLPLDICLEMGIQLCDVLAYLHGQCLEKPLSPMIHRDLKPSNIMLNVYGEVKVIDFGIASPLGRGFPLGHTSYGTPAYMAPEQIHNARLSPATDIFSLGVILFEMASGTRLFARRSAKKLLQHRRIHPAKISNRFSQITKCRLLRKVIKRALMPNPGQRYCSAARMGSALKLIQRHHGFETQLVHFASKRCA